ncbi:hypothetical protein GCM10027024_04930 [Microbacterium insulae]
MGAVAGFAPSVRMAPVCVGRDEPAPGEAARWVGMEAVSSNVDSLFGGEAVRRRRRVSGSGAHRGRRVIDGERRIDSTPIVSDASWRSERAGRGIPNRLAVTARRTVGAFPVRPFMRSHRIAVSLPRPRTALAPRRVPEPESRT